MHTPELTPRGQWVCSRSRPDIPKCPSTQIYPSRGGINKYATHILRTPPAAHGLGGAAAGARAHEGDGGAGEAYMVAPGDADPEQCEDLCGGRVRGLRESSPNLVSSNARQERGQTYVDDGVAA